MPPVWSQVRLGPRTRAVGRARGPRFTVLRWRRPVRRRGQLAGEPVADASRHGTGEVEGERGRVQRVEVHPGAAAADVGDQYVQPVAGVVEGRRRIAAAGPERQAGDIEAAWREQA